ncbi:MAG: anion permease [Bacteroidales bacterium]
MLLPILVPMLIGMFLALNMGGSGTAPSFSAAFGASVIKKFAIPGLFGIFVFAGAIIAGEKVVLTIGKGLMPAQYLTMVVSSIILLAISMSLLIANLLGVPQSTSQSTVFAVAGAAAYLDHVNYHKIFVEIIPMWLVLPVLGFVLTYLAARIFRKYLEDPKYSDYHSLGRFSLPRLLLIGSGCYVAFSIGSNNVANATGPLVSMLINELKISPDDNQKFRLIMILTTLVIAPLFGIGSSVFGYKVLKSAGKDITPLGPMHASLVSIITATLLLLASVTRGIPTSLVQLNSLAIMAISVKQIGFKKTLKNNTVKRFWLVWLTAPLFALAITLMLIYLADKAGILFY